MSNKIFRFIAFGLFPVVCLMAYVLAGPAVACPVCFGDLEPEQSRGFFWGIVFLIALPPTLILYIAGHVIHHSRKKARADKLLERADALIRGA